MPDQPRPVWLTREQRDAFEYLEDVLQTVMAVPVGQVVAAWDDAPADPVAAAAGAIAGFAPNIRRHYAEAVLRALGAPDA